MLLIWLIYICRECLLLGDCVVGLCFSELLLHTCTKYYTSNDLCEHCFYLRKRIVFRFPTNRILQNVPGTWSAGDLGLGALSYRASLPLPPPPTQDTNNRTTTATAPTTTECIKVARSIAITPVLVVKQHKVPTMLNVRWRFPCDCPYSPAAS